MFKKKTPMLKINKKIFFFKKNIYFCKKFVLIKIKFINLI